MYYEPITEVYRCSFCEDTGLVVAKDTNQNVYVFRHSCGVGDEKRSSYPIWTQSLRELYTPESRKK